MWIILPGAGDQANGGVAQMVERSLSMREVQGSIPCISSQFVLSFILAGQGRRPLIFRPICNRGVLGNDVDPQSLGADVPKRLRGWTRNPLGSARAGSSPAVCDYYARSAALAQLGERQTEDLKVPGSIPGGGTLCREWQPNQRILPLQSVRDFGKLSPLAKSGLSRESNPGPLAPEARIMPLDH